MLKNWKICVQLSIQKIVKKRTEEECVCVVVFLFVFLHFNKEIVPAEPVGLTNPHFLFYGPVQRAIDKEWGCNDDHFPALTLYFNGLCFSSSAKPKVIQ